MNNHRSADAAIGTQKDVLSNKLAGKSVYAADQVSCTSSRILVTRYQEFLKLHGAEITTKANKADILIVDTCGYSKEREDNSLAVVKQTEMTAKDGARVIVCGCLVGIDPQKLQEHFKGEFFAPKNENALAQILDLDEEETKFLSPLEARGRFMGPDLKRTNWRERLVVGGTAFLHRLSDYIPLRQVPRLGQMLDATQALNRNAYAVTISQGCLGACTYCVIPMAKGRTISLPMGLIVDKIRGVVADGVSRIILTSEDTGAYGHDIGTNIVHLLKQIHAIPGDFEIFIEFFDPRWLRKFGDELADVIALGRIRYIQLALQSGSNSVLKRMRRVYQVEHVLPHIRALRQRFPRLSTGTQIIAGFPGETEADFEATRALLREDLFDVVLVYDFSDRKGAAAEKMPDHLDQELVKYRGRVLRREWKLARIRRLLFGAPQRLALGAAATVQSKTA